jgi:hypothetical protein
VAFRNDSAGLLDRPDVHYITRHDLSDDTTTPTASASAAAPATAPAPPRTRLLYYVDAAAPPDIRDALIDGIKWWDEAFQHAGYPPGTIDARPGTPPI